MPAIMPVTTMRNKCFLYVFIMYVRMYVCIYVCMCVCMYSVLSLISNWLVKAQYYRCVDCIVSF